MKPVLFTLFTLWTALLKTYYNPAHGMNYAALKAHDAAALENPRGRLELRGVWFAYADRPRPVLCGVSLRLAPGQLTVLVGAASRHQVMSTSLPEAYRRHAGLLRPPRMGGVFHAPIWLRRR